MSEEKKSEQKNNGVKHKHNRYKAKGGAENIQEKKKEQTLVAKDAPATKTSAEKSANHLPEQPAGNAERNADKPNANKNKNRQIINKTVQAKKAENTQKSRQEVQHTRDSLQKQSTPESVNKNQKTGQTQSPDQKKDSNQNHTTDKNQGIKPNQSKNRNKNEVPQKTQDAANNQKSKNQNQGKPTKKRNDRPVKKQPAQFNGEFTDFSEGSFVSDRSALYTEAIPANKSILSQGTYEPMKSDIEYGKDAPFTDFSVAFSPSGIENKPDTETKEDFTNAAEENTESCIVIGIKFRSSGKVYYFDPDGIEYKPDTFAIVETTRGIEYGYVASGNHAVPITSVVNQLRKAIRPATKADKEHFAENCKKEKEAAAIWTEKVAQHNLAMKLVDVEYTFDNSKLLFHFTAEGRIDFRDLVKDLASLFRCRIELRQMGIRDEAKVLGGLGICGRPLCCATFLPDFAQVSIKMAKEQTISLNSAKISGNCGRLMCCLRYEHETYSEAIKRTPAVNSVVNTPQGNGVIVESKPLLELVKVRLDSNPDAIPSVFRLEEINIIKHADNHFDNNDE